MSKDTLWGKLQITSTKLQTNSKLQTEYRQIWGKLQITSTKLSRSAGSREARQTEYKIQSGLGELQAICFY